MEHSERPHGSEVPLKAAELGCSEEAETSLCNHFLSIFFLERQPEGHPAMEGSRLEAPTEARPLDGAGPLG